MSLRYCSIYDVPKNYIWYLLNPEIYPFSWIFPKLLLTAIQLKINLYSPVEEETNYGDFRRVVGKKRGVTLKVIPTSFQGVNLISLIWYPTPGNPGGGRLRQIWSYYKHCCKSQWKYDNWDGGLRRRHGQTSTTPETNKEPPAHLQHLPPKSFGERKKIPEVETNLLDNALIGSPQWLLRNVFDRRSFTFRRYWGDGATDWSRRKLNWKDDQNYVMAQQIFKCVHNLSRNKLYAKNRSTKSFDNL